MTDKNHLTDLLNTLHQEGEISSYAKALIEEVIHKRGNKEAEQ